MSGKFEIIRNSFGERKTSLDLGAKYAAGCHLAQIGCSECQGTDLGGAPRLSDQRGRDRISRSWRLMGAAIF